MKQNAATDLTNAIAALNEKLDQKELDVITCYKTTIESFKPLNIIKSGLKNLVGSTTIKDDIINSSIGIGAGLATKKLIVGSSGGFLKKILGGVVEFAIANTISNNGNILKNKAVKFLSQFSNKK